jgi:hypothetical protein
MNNFYKPIWNSRNPELIIPNVCKTFTRPKGVYCPLNITDSLVSVPKGSIYKLTSEETEQCILIGKERNNMNIIKGTKNMNKCGRNDEDISIQGVLGEYAFCKLFCLPIEIYDTACRNVLTEKRFDAVLPNKWTIDIKTTLYDKADLKISFHKKVNPPTLYGLMIYINATNGGKIDIENPPIISFRGLFKSSEAFQSKYQMKYVHKNGNIEHCYMIPQSDLKTLDDFIK